jgi:hypothetical protein
MNLRGTGMLLAANNSILRPLLPDIVKVNQKKMEKRGNLIFVFFRKSRNKKDADRKHLQPIKCTCAELLQGIKRRSRG